MQKIWYKVYLDNELRRGGKLYITKIFILNLLNYDALLLHIGIVHSL